MTKDQQEELDGSFIVACNMKKYDLMEELLGKGASVDAQNSRETTVLLGAVYDKDKKRAEWLLKKGANPNIANCTGDTPLIEASRLGLEELVSSLLDAKADTDMQSTLGSSALMEACIGRNFGCVSLLLKRKANPNLKSHSGTSALLNAAGKHDFETLALLLENGANANDSDGYDVPALVAAANPSMYEENPTAVEKCVALLLKYGADPNKKAKSGAAPISEASISGNYGAVRLLLKSGANPNVTTAEGPKGGVSPLICAISKKDAELVGLLLKANADPNLKNSAGLGPMQVVFGMAAAEKERAAVSEIVRMLLAAGGRMEQGGPNAPMGGMGLAHLAVLSGSEEMLDLAEKAKVLNNHDNEGHTALHFSLWVRKENFTHLLLEKGCDPNVKDHSGATPLRFLAENPMRADVVQVITMLKLSQDKEKMEQAERLVREGEESTRKLTELLLSKGADVNAADTQGWTPLMGAIKSYASGGVKRDYIEFLLEKGADVSIRNESDDHPIVLATKIGDLDLLQLLVANAKAAGHDEVVKSAVIDLCWTAPEHWSAMEPMKKCLEWLMANGADINFKDEDGQSPAIVATATAQEDLLKMLLELGADQNQRNNEGEIALFQAIGNNNPNITKILIDAGADLDASNNDGEDAMSIAYRYQNPTCIQQLRDAGAVRAKAAKP